MTKNKLLEFAANHGIEALSGARMVVMVDESHHMIEVQRIAARVKELPEIPVLKSAENNHGFGALFWENVGKLKIGDKVRLKKKRHRLPAGVYGEIDSITPAKFKNERAFFGVLFVHKFKMRHEYVFEDEIERIP